MINKLLKISFATAIAMVGTFFICSSQATAGVYSSEQVIAAQQHQYNKQQVLAFVDTAEVQHKLIELGVSPADAKLRIASMTNAELEAFNNQLNEMPSGGVVGTIVTVLVVIAVLDLMGITDVYPFIRPIGGS
ncbi:PA2779 family protein [Arsukibacterium sp.]|uniref:PA2779 family protein n=1 Tax=Arsukibacterium sp. TaxID=1977258 RepID=UPI00299DFC15|nr:PA2779 family protein [Arsukibacterium sp.]MDX1539206.1 PA2779 family protein [Arsukibacterium sp.]